MIPCPIVTGKVEQIPIHTIKALHQITHFIVEKVKTARRFIRDTGHPVAIDDLEIFELNKYTLNNELFQFLELHAMTKDIGVISESGCPGIADPGTIVAAWAHEKGIPVMPFSGPSSILLALMASGLSGQNFYFHGYLPHKIPSLIQKLKNLEKLVRKENSTQIFIETPYRNEFIIQKCIEVLPSDIHLCVAIDVLDENMEVINKKLANWKTQELSVFHKRPAVFLLGTK